MPSYRTANPSDATALTRFIIEQCRNPKRACLQSWSGESVAAAVQDLRRDLEADLLFELAVQSDTIVGAVGCDLDQASSRVWLRGPHLAERDDRRARRTAQQLWNRLHTRVPFAVQVPIAYVDQRNEFARSFWLRQTWASGTMRERTSLVFEHRQPAQGLRLTPVLRLHALAQEHLDAFQQLHRALFPSDVPEVEVLLDDTRSSRGLVALDSGGGVAGYVLVDLDAGGEGKVRYLGVRAELRCRGIGRQLLIGGIRALYAIGAKRVLLSVNESNGAARSLYESAGFRLIYVGIALRV